MNFPIPNQDPEILLGSILSGTTDIRIVILIAAAVVSIAYMYVKAFLPEIVATVIFAPIIEEPMFRLGLLEMVFLTILGMDLWICFVFAVLIFIVIHPFLCISHGLVDRLLRVCDATYIGVICGAYYCLQLEQHNYNVLLVVFVCILIHAACNLMVWLLKRIPIVPVHMAVRIGLALVYLFQLTQVQSWSFRHVMIPFFLHRFWG
jgi:hypothetical protein